MSQGAQWAWWLLFLALVFVFRKPLAQGVLKFQDWLFNRFGLDVPDKLKSDIMPATQLLIFSIACWIALNNLEMPKQLHEILLAMIESMMIIAIFNGLYRSVDLLITYLRGPLGDKTEVEFRWLRRILEVAIAIIGGALVLKVWGINVAPLVTGFGIVGAAIAVAAQDMMKHFFGGMINLAEKRYDIGDRIAVNGSFDGVVEKISMRSTTIRQLDSTTIYVPNGELANSPLINLSRMQHRRLEWNIKLDYDTSVEQLEQLTGEIETFLKEDDAFTRAPEFMKYAMVDDFDEIGVNLHVYCFTKTTDFEEFSRQREKLAFHVINTAKNLNITFTDRPDFDVEV